MLGYIGYPLCLLAHYLPAKYSVMHIPGPAGITQTYSEIRETFRLPLPRRSGVASAISVIMFGGYFSSPASILHSDSEYGSGEALGVNLVEAFFSKFRLYLEYS